MCGFLQYKTTQAGLIGEALAAPRVLSLLLLASLAAYTSLLLSPAPSVLGGSLADGPSAVLAHHQSGMRLKVPTRGGHPLSVFVLDHGSKHAQETVLLLHDTGG